MSASAEEGPLPNVPDEVDVGGDGGGGWTRRKEGDQ